MLPSAWNTGVARTRVLMLRNGLVTSCRGADQVAPKSSETMALTALPANDPGATET